MAINGSSSRRIWWIAFVAGMASYIDAAAIVSSGIAIVMLKDALGFGAGEVGVLSSLLTFSIAIGAIFGGRLGDRFGRRRVFIVTMAAIVVASILLILSPSFPVFLVGIVLLGVGSGADLPVSLATISEAARTSQRGGMVSFSQLLWKLGTIASQGLGALVGDSGRSGAQVIYAHIAVVAALTMIARLSVPESERWTAARTAAMTVPSEARSTGALRELLRRPYLTSFLALLAFYALINLGMNTNGQFGAYMFTEVAGTSVSFYSTVSLVTTVFGFVLVFVLMKVIDGAHRMTWFVVGVVCALVGSGLPAVLGANAFTLAAMLLLWAVFSVFSGEPMMKLWTQESFPTLLRSTAQGFIIAVARILAAVLALVTPLILGAGPTVLFAFIIAVVLIGSTIAFVTFRSRTTTEFDEEDEASLSSERLPGGTRA